MSRFLTLALATVVTALISTVAQAQPFGDRGYHPLRHDRHYHPHFRRHVPFHHGDDRR